MLGKIEGRSRRGHQRMRWLNSIIDAMNRNLGKLWSIVREREAWSAAVHRVTKSRTQLGCWTTMTDIIGKRKSNQLETIVTNKAFKRFLFVVVAIPSLNFILMSQLTPLTVFNLYIVAYFPRWTPSLVSVWLSFQLLQLEGKSGQHGPICIPLKWVTIFKRENGYHKCP